MNHVSIAKLNVHHLGCKHGFLSIQYSKLPNKSLANYIFRANHQIFDSPIIPRIRYRVIFEAEIFAGEAQFKLRRMKFLKIANFEDYAFLRVLKFESKIAFTISSIVRGYHVYKDI